MIITTGMTTNTVTSTAIIMGMTVSTVISTTMITGTTTIMAMITDTGIMAITMPRPTSARAS